MFDQFLNPAWVTLTLRYLHWVALVVLFAASAARYSLLARGDTDQHRLYQALGVNRIALFAIALLLLSGGALILLNPGQRVFTLLTRPIFLLKLVLVAVAWLLLIYPWLFTRKNAVVRSFGWVNVPDSVRWMLRLDIAIFFAVLFAALLLGSSLELWTGRKL